MSESGRDAVSPLAPTSGSWGGAVGRSLAVALLVAQAALLAHGLPRWSVVVDEFAHLPAGVAYWKTGRFFLYRENLPLVKLLAALPAVAAGPVMDYDHYAEFASLIRLESTFGGDFQRANPIDYHRFFVLGRVPIAGLTLLGGWYVYKWARTLYGELAGLLALTLWVTDPNVLTWGRLITTDMGATVLGFIATYTFWRYTRSPSWSGVVASGVLLGLAQLTKFTEVLLYPT